MSGQQVNRMTAVAVTLLATSLVMAPTSNAQEYQLPDTQGWGNYVEYYYGARSTRETVRAELIAQIDHASIRVDAAIRELDDAQVSAALIRAAERGVSVRLVADAEFEDAEGFAELVDHESVEVVFGDGELNYLPDPTLSPLLTFCLPYEPPAEASSDRVDHISCTRAAGGFPENTSSRIERPDGFNVMSHTFFIIDETWVWNITAPLTDEQPVWLAFRMMSEEIARSFEREFRQMYGGVFSTTLSVYNGPLKSITHTDPTRPTNEGQIRIMFNPQERLVKQVIDEVYRARGSVFVMTEDLQNRDLINALRYKHENGFDVRVLVGRTQGHTGRLALEEIDGLNLVEAPSSLGRLPTFVVLDSEEDRRGRRNPTRVQILSHELWRTEPFEVATNLPDDIVRFFPSDTFADGVLWEIVENWGLPTPAAQDFAQFWETMWTTANQ